MIRVAFLEVEMRHKTSLSPSSLSGEQADSSQERRRIRCAKPQLAGQALDLSFTKTSCRPSGPRIRARGVRWVVRPWRKGMLILCSFGGGHSIVVSKASRVTILLRDDGAAIQLDSRGFPGQPAHAGTANST